MTEDTPSQGWEDKWKAVCARRWWILGMVFVCWALAWTISWLLPNKYESETLVLLEEVPEYMGSNLSMDLQRRLQSMTSLPATSGNNKNPAIQQITADDTAYLLSRARLLRIIEQCNLYRQERESGMDAYSLVDSMRKDIQIELEQSADHRQLNSFRIYYAGDSPARAQQVVGQLTSAFIEENLQAQQQQSESTTQFLSRQLDEARRKLAEQEARIKEFKIQNLGEMPGQGLSNEQIQNGLQNRQQSLAGALERAQQERLYLGSLLAQYRSVQILSGADEAGSPPALERESTRLRNELKNAEAIYKSNYPDVIRLRAQLARTEKLKQQRDSQLATLQQSGAAERPTTSADLHTLTPVLQIESQLKANDLRVKELQQDLRDVQQQIDGLQRRLQSAPAREQQLADLNHDYEQSKANYDFLLKKHMESEARNQSGNTAARPALPDYRSAEFAERCFQDKTPQDQPGWTGSGPCPWCASVGSDREGKRTRSYRPRFERNGAFALRGWHPSFCDPAGTTEPNATSIC